MNSIVQIRQISQYPDLDPVFPDDRAVLQRGGPGGAYGSASAANLVATALAQGGDLLLAPGSGVKWESGGLLTWASGQFVFDGPVSVPGLESAGNITAGGRMVATIEDVNALAAYTVQSFNGRTGIVQLELPDVLRAGGAPIRDAHFGGWITAPSLWDTRADDDTVATTNWVHRAIHDTGVCSFNGRTGCVVLQTSDVNAAYAALDGTYPTAPTPALGDASNRIATTLFVDESLADLHLTISDEQLAILTSTYAPIDSPNFTGIPAGPTANPGTHTGQLATTAFVMAAVTASTSGVSSFNTRTGAVTLSAADISGAGGALLNSPAFVGGPTAPTAAPGTSNTVLATTAFVAAAVSASAAGVSSFNTRTGAVVLSLADVQATNVLNNTALTGVPTGPTAAPGTSTTQLATTAFVSAAGVSSFNSRTGAVTLSGADVSAAGGALTAGPAFTGTPTAPTPATSDNSTALATTAFVKAALSATGVTTFNGRAGAVTLTAADITGAGGALLASPTFTGTPAAPTPTVGDNSTTLATTAFVAAALVGGGATPGWTLTYPGGTTSKISALGTTTNTFNIGGPALSFQNKNGGQVCYINDTTVNSSLGNINYPILRNAVTGSPAVLSVGGTDVNRSIQLVAVGSGTIQVPTMAPGDNSTAAASTAFVHAAVTAPVVRSYLAGLILSTAGSSATFSVAPGVAVDSTNVQMITLAAALSKTTAAWAVGNNNGSLDTGTIANSTWYHVFLIERTDLTVADVLVSLSPSAPAMPANYTFFRRIGSLRTNASGQWTYFHQLGDEFLWDVPVADVNGVVNQGTTAVLRTMTVPAGVQVKGLFSGGVIDSAANTADRLYISSPDVADTAPGVSTFNFGQSNAAVSQQVWIMFSVRTNTSAQIRTRNETGSSTQQLFINTQGWIDRRGRDA